jgi:hypothetical protein
MLCRNVTFFTVITRGGADGTPACEDDTPVGADVDADMLKESG